MSVASVTTGTVNAYGLIKRIEPARGCRTLGKKDMRLNDTTPQTEAI